MNSTICLIVIVTFAIRLIFLRLSRKNEARILSEGGSEYGCDNTKRLTILHILFYTSCFVEAIVRKADFDYISLAGLIILIFSMCMLYVVTRLLKGIWTVKLMIVKNHKFNNHWLFRSIKHPNYFLNVIPELIGLALLCHAVISAIVLLPFYIVVLSIRIREENQLIRDIILPNGIEE